MTFAANAVSLRNSSGIDLNVLCQHHLSDLVHTLWAFYESHKIPCTYGLSGPPPKEEHPDPPPQP